MDRWIENLDFLFSVFSNFTGAFSGVDSSVCSGDYRQLPDDADACGVVA